MGVSYLHKTDDAKQNELRFYEAGAFPDDRGHNGLASYADSDYAASYTRRSTSGYVVYLNGGPISWRSTLQTIMAQNTAEAKIITATDCVKEGVHARLIMEELGAAAVNSKPTTVYEDNRAAQLMCHNEKSNKGVKHFEVRLCFLQERVNDETVRFTPVATDYQIADVLTKPLAEFKFRKFASKLVA